jgi:ATP-dependent DNA helicase RecQ
LVVLTQYGGLGLTEQGHAVLNGASVRGQLQTAPRAAETYATPPAPAYDEELFAQLRELRLHIAESERIPPYMIFGDRSLQEMATYYPQSEATFAAVYGVGEYKLAHYAAQFIEMIQTYCAAHGLTECLRPERTDRQDIVARSNSYNQRVLRSVELLEQGRTIQEIASDLGLVPSTILGYFERYCAAGHPLPGSTFLAESSITPTEQAEVIAQFEQLGIERLGPIFYALEERVAYVELHLLRLCYRIRMNAAQQTPLSQ